jgi:hypothetical protein
MSLRVACAQAAATYRVAGHIVSAGDGHPLQRASVELLDDRSRNPVASVVSDEYGAFTFPGVPAGHYPLRGSAPGFLPSLLDQHEVFSTAVVTGAGVDTGSLTLKLEPEAALTGLVTDESGEPVRRTQIALYREDGNSGIARIQRFRTAQTDDLGTYDFSHLPPGRYFVSATATPWYAVHPNPPQPSGAFVPDVGIVDALDPTLDVAYPITFYPEATDSSAAEPILLHPGDQPHADIRLTPRPAIAITLPRTLEVGGNPGVQLEQMVFGFPEPLYGTTAYIPNSGPMLTGVPPGQYILKETIAAKDGTSIRSFHVDTTYGVPDLDAAKAEQQAEVDITVKSPDGSKPPAQTIVALVRTGAANANSSVVNEKGEAHINGVEPGDYRIAIQTADRSLAVARVLAAGKPLSRNRFQIAPGTSLPLTVLAAPATGSLHGFAFRDGKPAPGAMVVLIPAKDSYTEDLFSRDQSDLDGGFHIAALPAGRYSLLAIDDGWDLEWHRPEVLARYLPAAIEVSIPAGTAPDIHLDAPISVQPR